MSNDRLARLATIRAHLRDAVVIATDLQMEMTVTQSSEWCVRVKDPVEKVIQWLNRLEGKATELGRTGKEVCDAQSALREEGA